MTPGPNNTLLMSSGVNYGLVKTLPHIFGIIVGVPTMFLIVGLGLGNLFLHHPEAHQIIRILGTLFLLYLAWRIATTVPKENNQILKPPMRFWQAFLFQWVNGKGWTMISSAVAIFSSPGGDTKIDVLLIASAFFLASFPAVFAWTIFGQSIRVLLKNTLHYKIFNTTMAIILLLTITPVIKEIVYYYI